jgi:hypothetical protein
MCGHEQTINLLFETEPVFADPTLHTVHLLHPGGTSSSLFLHEFCQVCFLNGFG